MNPNKKQSKSQAAVKVSIEDIITGTYVDEKGNSFLKTKRGNISRVRLLGTVVDKFISNDENYGFIVLDDSTETIRLKFFKQDMPKLKKLEVGDIIDSIGNIGMYKKEIHVVPKIIKKITNPNWELLRTLELQELDEGSAEDENITDLVLEKINEMDDENGVSLEAIVKELNRYEDKKVIDAVRELMFKGELFEPKRGLLKPV